MIALRQISNEDKAELSDPIKNDQAIARFQKSFEWKIIRAYIFSLENLLAETNKLGEGESISSYGARRLADDHATEFLEKVLSFVETTASALESQSRDEANRKKEGESETSSE